MGAMSRYAVNTGAPVAARSIAASTSAPSSGWSDPTVPSISGWPWPRSSIRRSFGRAGAAEVGVLEAHVVLQAVAGQPVHADVPQPEQAQGERQRVVADGSGQRHGGRQQLGVPEVVHGRADPGAEKVAEHEQVG